MKKPCKQCGNPFEAFASAAYCSDTCRDRGYKDRYKRYRQDKAAQVKRSKLLTDEQKAERFSVRVRTVKGTVMLSRQERRAVKMIPAEGEAAIFIEYLTPGVIDTMCPYRVKHTFKEIQ